jgi:hypothetical protein
MQPKLDDIPDWKSDFAYFMELCEYQYFTGKIIYPMVFPFSMSAVQAYLLYDVMIKFMESKKVG